MPDNAIYYHIAYILAAIVYGGYAGMLYWRRLRVRAKALRTAD